MAKLQNDLFIGSEHLTIEGRSIKHPALIKEFGMLTSKKVRDEPISVIGMDIETNHLTGEPKLLGFYDQSKYKPYTKNFLSILYMYLRACKSENKSLVYWNKLDSNVLFRILLQYVNHEEQKRSLEHFGKISGEWDKKNECWELDPVIAVHFDELEIGIKNVIRSSIQFYYKRPDDDEPITIWAYDVAQLYQFGIQKEAEKRLPYYSKVDESAHLVDWDKFDNNKKYRNDIVLKSNELDARAVHDLALHIQEDFKKAFKYYPKSLISQGSFARSAIYAQIYNKLSKHIPDKKELEKQVRDELASIGIANYQDEWVEEYGADMFKDIQALFTEAYSGGMIESIMYGYTKEGYTADIASAYPGVIQNLWDLRGARIIHGKGRPDKMPNTYTLCRGLVEIPKSIKYHPLTVKHWKNKDTNIRPTGKFRASYTINERTYLSKRGARFYDEEYYHVVTKGKLSPLAEVTMEFIKLRQKMEKELKGSGFMPKIAVNSLYGILFEAVDTYMNDLVEKEIIVSEDRDTFYKDIIRPYRHNIDLSNLEKDRHYLKAGWHKKGSLTPDVVADELKNMGVPINSHNPNDIMEEINTLYKNSKINREYKTIEEEVVKRAGYRAGEFWNPLYATIITSETRLLMAEASDEIDKAGGKVILQMTDSILWEGSAEMLPQKYWKKEKTLGYFEQPEKVYDIVCLGSGRYGYTVKEKEGNSYKVSKKRGLNVTDIHDPEGIMVDEFDWANALKLMEKNNSTTIDVSVRTLISPGVILHNSKFTVDDLGRIIDDKKTVEAIVGRSKRYYTDIIKNPSVLATSLVQTEAIHLTPEMFGTMETIDQTLPFLREAMGDKVIKSMKEKRRGYNRNTQKRYYKKHRKRIRADYNKIYTFLSQFEFNAQEKSQMANWSYPRMVIELKEKGLPTKGLVEVYDDDEKTS